MKNRPSILLFALLFLVLCRCADRSIEKGYTSLQLGDYEMAISFFHQVLKKNPRNYDARLGMGKALIQKAIDHANDTTSWRHALTNLEAARTLRPEEDIGALLAEAWTVHARALLSAEDTVEALSGLARAIEHHPSSVEPLNLAGIVYFRMGDADKAEVLFRKAVDLDTEHPSGYFNLGMVCWRQDRLADAHGYWLKAIKRAPDDEDILYWFALAEKKLRRKQ